MKTVSKTKIFVDTNILFYANNPADIFDFNIAALLKSDRIGYILTHNVRDFEKFNDWLTIIPLIPT
jgi:predicted nucleic acid-binding protein